VPREFDVGAPLRYRCHGRLAGRLAVTAEAAQADEARRTGEPLRSLPRNHRERAAPAGRMAERERGLHRDDLADGPRRSTRGYEQDAEIIRRLPQQRRHL